MIKVQRKVSLGLKLLQYYTTKVWTFKNDNLKSLMNKLNDDDREKFYFDIKVVLTPFAITTCNFLSIIIHIFSFYPGKLG